MSLFRKVKEAFKKPELLPEKSEWQKERDAVILDIGMMISELDEDHDYLIYALANPDKSKKPELFYGDDWNVLFTLEEATYFCMRWAEDNCLDIGQTYRNLLSENRRKPNTDYALKTGVAKGNLHKYGRCPFIDGSGKTYSKFVLLKWLENNVRPHAKSIEDNAA